MPFVLLEDLKRPMPKRTVAIIASVRILRPLVKLCRYTFRGSRFLIRNAASAFRAIRLRIERQEKQLEMNVELKRLSNRR
jgi:hypothetical protein